MDLLNQYKLKFPKAEDPLDYVAKFGFEKIEELMSEAISQNKEIKFTTTNYKVTFNI